VPIGELEKKEVKDVRQTPYPLPDGFEWVTVDLNNDKELNEVKDIDKSLGIRTSQGQLCRRYGEDFQI
jgi:glycylpeptide N-tetradecanoyltransferase